MTVTVWHVLAAFVAGAYVGMVIVALLLIAKRPSPPPATGD